MFLCVLLVHSAFPPLLAFLIGIDHWGGFSGFGESSSVMFCGSFHASATNLYTTSACCGSHQKCFNVENSLRMASPRHKLLLLVHELDRSVRQRLANCFRTISIKNPVVSVYQTKRATLHLSHVTSALMISPTLPPDARYVTKPPPHGQPKHSPLNASHQATFLECNATYHSNQCSRP